MSLEATRAQLAQLLDNDDIKVVALSGKWGTGKSHIWERLQTDSKNDKVTSALYASLFGLTSIDQLKMKLIQSAAPALEKNAALFDSAKKDGIYVEGGPAPIVEDGSEAIVLMLRVAIDSR